MGQQRKINLGITQEEFPEGLHICHVFNDDKERIETLSKFVKEGLKSDEKLAFFIDSMTVNELLDSLDETGVDGVEAEKHFFSKALDVYCPDQHFVTDDMLERFRNHYSNSMDEGFCGARAVGDMSWALSQDAETNLQDLAEYECKLNHVYAAYPCTTICSYDSRKFDGGTIMDMLAVHPYVIVRGQLHQNPVYIPPEEFLEELKDRQIDAS